KVKRGDPYHGPFYPREPDQIIKRVVRGMLPKNTKGRNALKKLKVYISIPDSLKDKKPVRIGAAENKLKCKYVELGKLAGKLGAKVRW
ncbi:MAG: uL13 family ribosomal protein, partial [Candidatus Aenigmarchaeota archaeon]